MNPALFKAIVERCEYDWNLNLHGPNENQRLMPIILELLSIAEERGKALQEISNCETDHDHTLHMSVTATEALDSTTKRLEQLGLGEGK